MRHGVRKTTEQISLLMTLHLKRQGKALAVAVVMSFLPLLLHPDQGNTLVPYEIQMYQNTLYRYGVWIIFLFLFLYCFFDMLRWQQGGKKIQRYRLLPVTPLQLHSSWLLSFVVIFAAYFLIQGCLFLLFYYIVMARQPQLVTDNGLFFSVWNAVYTRAYLPMGIADSCLWVLRILSFSILAAFFGAGLPQLRRHWLLAVLFVCFAALFIGCSFISGTRLASLYYELIGQLFSFNSLSFFSIENVRTMLLLLFAAALALLELCYVYRLQRKQRRSSI